jgi:hypothetical protein
VKELMRKDKVDGKFMGGDTREEDKEGGLDLENGSDILGGERRNQGGKRNKILERRKEENFLWVFTSGLVVAGILGSGPGNLISWS